MPKIPQPRRCRQCPGTPFLHQCSHTKVGKAYLEGVAQAQAFSVTQTVVGETVVQEAGLDFTPSEVAVPSPTQNLDTLFLDPALLGPNVAHTVVELPLADAPQLIPIPHGAFTPQAALLPIPMTDIPAPASNPGPMLPLAESNTSAMKPSKKRIQVSAKDAPFGYVKGCLRGKHPYDIPRSAKLRAPEPLAWKAKKRYGRLIHNLVSRCERISMEVGCWLVVSAQLPNTGEQPIHYASPKFLAEARADAGEICTTFSKATSALTMARRQNATELAKRLDNVQALKDKAQEENDRLRSILQGLGVDPAATSSGSNEGAE
ncbi:hypothetical protein BDN72DRAFT_906851 [Pluteus cervinus]|uniref:Uncharacterized protein n=1 Tax=Pluteus cervinus TaxID=181527 RepID=A0ACD2ZXR5_9AGAR|nr:hypothetical protein BDN72DRAFT_906851 [Pluteus cervinus]